jgi:hypothetical protein
MYWIYNVRTCKLDINKQRINKYILMTGYYILLGSFIASLAFIYIYITNKLNLIKQKDEDTIQNIKLEIEIERTALQNIKLEIERVEIELETERIARQKAENELRYELSSMTIEELNSMNDNDRWTGVYT